MNSASGESLITFEQAVEQSQDFKRRHLLLGNGFSVALFRDIFSYTALFEKAPMSTDSRQSRVFQLLGTTDFEYAIRRLEESSRIIQEYPSDSSEIQDSIRRDVGFIKDALLESIVDNHPPNHSGISGRQFESSGHFLKNVVGDDGTCGCIYTVNYDLLLYWTIMKCEGLSQILDDGFRKRVGRMVWLEEKAIASQNVHYLHGALHLQQLGDKTRKLLWREDKPIQNQVAQGIDENNLPLFVTEGAHTQKLSRIVRSPYLRRAYLCFRDDMMDEGSCLFTFGHRLADVDEHILASIVDGKIRRMFVGIYSEGGVPDSAAREVMERAKKLAERRPTKRPLMVTFYDARSARVWDR